MIPVGSYDRDSFGLPRKDEDAVAAIQRALRDEEWRVNNRRLRWAVASLYMAGERKFQLRGPFGIVSTEEFLENPTGAEGIGLLGALFNKVVGLLNSIDVRPLVVREDSALPAIRDRARVQIILNSVEDHHKLEDTRLRFVSALTLWGAAGLHAAVHDFPSVGLTAYREVVHPAEVRPFPCVGSNLGALQGVMRLRNIPEDLMPKAWKSKAETMDSDLDETWVWGWPSGPKDSRSDEEKRYRVIETWIYGPRGNVVEYVASSGNKILQRESYEQVVAYPPLAFERFHESGDFWGLGLVDLVFLVVRDIEKLARDFVASVREQDRYATVILPAGTVDERKFFSDNRQSLRVLAVDPEPKGVFGSQAPVLRPTVVAPPTAGDGLAKASVYLQNLVQTILPLRDIVDEKGRVDSFAGLQLLQSEAIRPITLPSSAVAKSFGSSYRYVASRAVEILREAPRAIPVGRLSLDMIGAVVDVENATMTITPVMGMPDVSRLRFTVRHEEIRTAAARKMEAIQLLQIGAQAGIKDGIDFIIHAVREGIDFEMDLTRERGAYDDFVGTILGIVRDGESPGTVVVNPHFAYPQLQIRLMDALLANPIIKRFSADVQNRLIQYRETLLSWQGMILPQGVQDPLAALGSLSAGGGPQPQSVSERGVPQYG